MEIIYKRFFSTVAPCVMLGFSCSTMALTLTFDEPFVEHGTIISDQYSDHGVIVHAVNVGGGPDLAVAYNTTPRAADSISNRDPDLTGDWGGGNALVLQEDARCSSLTCYLADDEGSRPSGSIFLEFDMVINGFSFDFIDFEQPEITGAEVRYLDENSNEVGSVSFSDLSGAIFGDNSFNSSGYIQLSGLSVRALEFNLGGSGALDNISVSTVPLPASLPIFALGLIGLQVFRRRIQKKRE